MDFQRRRLAASALLDPTPVVWPRDADAVSSSTASATSALSTVSPFDHGLNGVNQVNNILFQKMLWWTLGIFGLAILAVRIFQVIWGHIRQVSAMTVEGERQTYWKYAQSHWMPDFKKDLLYAPLWGKRHNREIRLSKAMNMGTLPSRLHFILLFIYSVSNVVYMFYLDWSNENRYSLCAETRGRSGTLGLVNMIPLIIFAGRNNPLISMLKISFDTYNLFHRWIGRLAVAEILVHFLSWSIVQLAATGFSGLMDRVLHDPFIASGTAGTWALFVLLILSLSPIRHAFYETFLNTHIMLAFITFVCTLVHCLTPTEIPTGLPQLTWIIAIFCIWMFDRLARMIRLTYCNWSTRGFTEAVVEAMPGECSRVTMHLPRHVEIKPGTHAYIRFAGIKPWENHPFSIAWIDHHAEELPKNESEPMMLRRNTTTSVSFVIGAQTGFTRDLFNRASEADSGAIKMRAAFEGPYGGHHDLDSYGHAVLVAGATGITHQLSYLRPLIEGFNNGSVATRRITLIWIVRDYEALEWIRPWMDEVLRMPNRKKILTIKLFVTRPKNAKEIVSASTTVQMFPGRPNIPLLIRKEVHEQMGAMAVTVCGPGALADDVRSGVRDVQEEGTVVDFFEESFTW
ncbi:Ferric/cupric reductase transmembrane component 2 [Cytospora mali]|uniref:Ferric/cupric reductase transmembrane component 2 n=1 Tax=Cytospora mali TaxID=578113 RepID=A0A194VBN7_CYTMA|nr:Ferric/cupric reductase transmembrane component 2 [Valsa mali var. pyri (nom. inval.)]